MVYVPPKASALTVNWHMPVMLPAEAVHLKGLGIPQRGFEPSGLDVAGVVKST